MQINYAKAADIANLLKSGETTLMSDRGMATTDERTNTLLVQDTGAKLAEIRKLIARLDIPVRQVLIESRIVKANDDFARDIGVRFGFDNTEIVNSGNTTVNYGGGLPGDFIFDFPIVGAGTGAFGFNVAKLGSYTLDLELSAMEIENKGEIISSPRVLTSNQKAAFIETGTEIPYQEASSSGATTTSFKKAVLRLEVTPQITPDDRIIMDLVINNDSVGEIFNQIPSIDTDEISTQVLVDNGETLVLGGIYEEERTNVVTRTPFFGELPLVGWLFRNTNHDNDKSELLIFITPKIVKEGLNI
jgi:type IV pilus assembly protein PilQ